MMPETHNALANYIWTSPRISGHDNQCLVQLKIAGDAPRWLGFAI